MKTCAKCLKVTSEKRGAKKRQAGDKENNDMAEERTHKRFKLSADEVPTLSWEAFVTLLAENKDNAFELEAFVSVTTGPLTEAMTGLERAKIVSQAVREATGYRFKYVLYVLNIICYTLKEI
jgi:hypothetical protein